MSYVTHAPYSTAAGTSVQEEESLGQGHAVNYRATRDRVRRELKALGMSRWGFMKLSTKYLPTLIHDHEHIEAIVYGANEQGSAMLVATDTRVMFLDKEPMFARSDELTYDIVGGVSYNHVGLVSRVVLHTRIGDFTVRTINTKCAQHFRKYIEDRCLEHKQEDGDYRSSWPYGNESDINK